MPFKLPPGHPLSTMVIARAFLWLQATSPEKAVSFAERALSRYFGHGVDVASAHEIVRTGEAVGVHGSQLAEAIQPVKWKAAFHRQTERAVEKGVFGSPFFFIDGEPFWGSDRMEMMDSWLRDGGW